MHEGLVMKKLGRVSSHVPPAVIRPGASISRIFVPSRRTSGILKPFVILLLALVLLGGAIAAQEAPASPTDPARLAAGREFLSKLMFDASADAVLFSGMPDGEPEKLLMELVAYDQRYDAGLGDWRELHKALNGVIEIHLYRGRADMAAVFTEQQAAMYRVHEQDYVSSLDAERRALTLVSASPSGLDPSLCWMNIGQDLYRLVRNDEALEAMRKAQGLMKAQGGMVAGTLWRNIVQAELARRDRDAAKQEVAKFMAASKAPQASASFRALALLAASDVQESDSDYDGVLDSARQALQAINTDPEANIMAFAVAGRVLECVIAASIELPHKNAVALAGRIATQFPDLPIPVADFAARAVQRRRRLAGDFDALLREDNDRISKARAAQDKGSLIEALVSQSLDYAAFNGAQQEITLLQEASALLTDEMKDAKYPGSEGVLQYRLLVLNNLGQAYVEVGEAARAQDTYDELLHVIDAVPSAMVKQQVASFAVDATLGKARISELQNESSKTTLDLFNRALAGSGGKGNRSRGYVLLRMALAMETAKQEPSLTAATYEQAIKASEEERDSDSRLRCRLAYARFLTTGAGLSLPDATSKAREQLELAEAASRQMDMLDARWKMALGFGLFEESQGNLKSAITRYQDAVEQLERIRVGLSLQEARQSLMDNQLVQDLYSRLISLLTKVGAKQQAWQYLERDKARSFFETLQGKKFTAVAAVANTAALGELERNIVRLRTELLPENRALVTMGGKDPAALWAELEHTQAEFALNRQQRQLAASRAGQATQIYPPELADVQGHVPRGTAIIEYAWLKDQITAFIVTHSALDQVTWKSDINVLTDQILRLRDRLAQPGAQPSRGFVCAGCAENTAAAEELIPAVSAALVEPVLARLGPDIKRLIVVPAGAANYLPFQVLIGADGRPLIARYTITYLPSGSTFPILGQKAARRPSVFLGALGNANPQGWAPLPGTLQEVTKISSLFPSATLAEERRFTALSLRTALVNQDFVHLATHGQLDETSPLFSALITSPALGQPSQVFLYEIMDMKLRAKLVVLSACNTGIGKLRGGDEVIGLNRTFLIAGADAVVASLWSVDDVATAMLMSEFYKALKAGQTPGEALRSAQLAIRHDRPSAFYWAGFVVSASH